MGKLVSGILGMDNGMKAGGDAVAAGNRYADPVYFKPYTMTTGQGQTSFSDGEYTASLSPENAFIQQQAQLGMSGLLPQYYSGVSQAPSQLGFNYDPASQFGYSTPAAQFSSQYNAPALTAQYDPSQEVSRIFEQESALLKPKFEQQATDLQSQLFGSGRLGMKLASAEAGGMVNPEAYGLQRAQQQTLAEVAASATQRGQEAAQQRFTAQQAMDEASRQRSQDIFGAQKDIFSIGQGAALQAQQSDLERYKAQLTGAGQAYDVSSGMFNINAAQRQQQLENLLGGYESMYKTAFGSSALENELMKIGIDAESARAMAAASAGQIGTSGYNTAAQAGMAQDKAMGSLFGGIASAAIGKWSDKNLKKNIKKIGTLSNGINIYSWEWNEAAKKLGAATQETFGVIAQEIAKIIPNAVSKDSSGYLKVNYSKVWNY